MGPRRRIGRQGLEPTLAWTRRPAPTTLPSAVIDGPMRTRRLPSVEHSQCSLTSSAAAGAARERTYPLPTSIIATRAPPGAARSPGPHC
jgi:hypothetical protein